MRHEFDAVSNPLVVVTLIIVMIAAGLMGCSQQQQAVNYKTIQDMLNGVPDYPPTDQRSWKTTVTKNG